MLRKNKVSSLLEPYLHHSIVRGMIADCDSVVRALVEQRLQTELTGDKKIFLDRQIDIELENM